MIAAPTIKKAITVNTFMIVIQYSTSPNTLTLTRFNKYKITKKTIHIENVENCLKNSQ